MTFLPVEQFEDRLFLRGIERQIAGGRVLEEVVEQAVAGRIPLHVVQEIDSVAETDISRSCTAKRSGHGNWPARPRMSVMSDLVVVVTGASTGIGAALAEQLATRGRIGRARRPAGGRPERDGGTLRRRTRCPIVADMTVRADVRRARCRTTMARFGHIDVWVNNVGQGITRMPTELTDEDIDDMIRVNVKSRAVRHAGGAPALQGARTRARHQRVLDARPHAVRGVPVGLQRREALSQRADRQLPRAK